VITETELRALKPRAKPYKVHDERGSFLIVRPNGARLWRLKYYIDGVAKTIALGQYPDTSLALHRKKRDDARARVADGKDPGAERKAAKLAKKQAGADTFRSLGDEWLAQQAKTNSANTIDMHRARLTSVLYPAFGRKPISTIKAPDLLAVLRSVEANGNHETAHRLRALHARIERFAIATGRLERGICADLIGALTPVKTQHFAAIVEPRKFGQLLRAIHGYSGFNSVVFALQIAAHTFVRPGELRGAAWSEIDFAAAEWRIPGERMKLGEPHIVPLSSQVLALLHELHALKGDGQLLFPGLRTPTRPISDNSINAALRGMGFAQGVMTCHGFRSSASSMLNELGVDPQIIELQLAHREQNATRDAYNRAQRLSDRRAMMQRWSDYLDELRAGKPEKARRVAKDSHAS
jgi:integrase